MVAIRTDRHIVFANERAEALLDVHAGSRFADRVSRGMLEDIVERLVSGGDSLAETSLTTTTGRVLRVSGTAASDDEPALVVVDDVTAVRRHDQAMHDFVRNAAHELRTPLTGIATAIEVLQSGAKEIPADRDRFLAHLERHTARLTRIARALLMLARAQSGEQLLLGGVELAPLLDRVAAGASPAEGVSVSTECPAGLAARAQADLLEQALAAVVDNAARHTKAGEIKITAANGGGKVAIDVLDTGEGVAPEHRARIFEPFYRSGAGTTGFGLGLAIATQAVEAMDGRLELVDAPRGAHFSIRLPVA